MSNGRGAGAIAWMAQHRIAANLLMILLIGGGVWTALHVQKEVFPQFQLDVVNVDVGYPGAAPEEVEKGILLPIEEAVRGLQGIEEITSTAREGRGRVTIELVAGSDRMQAFQEIDQAINRIRTFPEDIDTPEVRLASEQRGVMRIGLYGEVDVWSLRGLAEQLRDQLLSDPEITQVELSRVASYVTHVEIPLATLRAHGLTLGEVADIIEQSSRDVPAGAAPPRSPPRRPRSFRPPSSRLAPRGPRSAGDGGAGGPGAPPRGGPGRPGGGVRSPPRAHRVAALPGSGRPVLRVGARADLDVSPDPPGLRPLRPRSRGGSGGGTGPARGLSRHPSRGAPRRLRRERTGSGRLPGRAGRPRRPGSRPGGRGAPRALTPRATRG